MPGSKGEFSWIFFIPTVILLGLSVFFLVKNIWVMTHFQRTTGKITDFDSSTIKGGQTVYQTKVEYQTPDGTTHEAGSLTRSNSVSAKIGDPVTIYYNSKKPEEARVHTFRDTWLHILILGGIGSLLFIIWFGILMGPPSTPTPTTPPTRSRLDQ